MRQKPPSIFCGFIALRITILTTVSLQVLAVERRTPNVNQRNQQQQWYERNWKTSSPESNTDSIYIDDSNSRSRLRDGSGNGVADDLDSAASGYGVDDEDSDSDSDSELEGGSGGTVGGSRVDVGSGHHVDIDLPPKQVHPATDLQLSTTGASSTSVASTAATSAHSLALVTTTTEPFFIGPVTTATTEPETTSLLVESTSTATRPTTSSVLFTRATTTSAEPTPRKRPTTVATSSTTREIQKTSPKLPPMFDDTNKTTAQSFWMRPGVLAGLIGGAVAGLLAAILLVMFVIYRMRKKDEGSYALDEPKSPPTYTYAYQKAPTREFYA